MKKKTSMILLIIIFMIGLGVFMYPRITSFYNRTVLVKQSNAFCEEIKMIEETNLDKLYEDMKVYNNQIYEDSQKNLNSQLAYEIPAIDLSLYDIENNRIGVLKIDVINLIVPILLGASEENMSEGITHLSNTSLPIGGNNTNCVLAGHRGMITKDMFRDIHKLNIGNIVQITNFWETLEYEVVSKEIIHETDLDKVLIQENKDMITLISCEPYPREDYRYLVYCTRV